MKAFDTVLQRLIDAELDNERLRKDLLDVIEQADSINIDRLLEKIEQLERINFELSSDNLELNNKLNRKQQ